MLDKTNVTDRGIEDAAAHDRCNHEMNDYLRRSLSSVEPTLPK